MASEPRRKLNTGVADNHGMIGLVRNARFYETNHGRYRPWLERSWGLHQGTLVSIGVNPSTAGDVSDDPTIMADYRLAIENDCEHLIKLNLFDLCSTDPKVLQTHRYPDGGNNFEVFEGVFAKPKSELLVVASWGNYGVCKGQDWATMKWLDYWGVKVWCLGYNQNGTPKHELYVSPKTKLQKYVY